VDQLKELFAALGTTARVILGVILCVTLYFMPTGIGVIRGRTNTGAIFALNLFLGWSVIGWVVAFVWAVKAEGDRSVTVVVNNHAA
jgi:hypothetical protein